jgi:hypothetical protein
MTELLPLKRDLIFKVGDGFKLQNNDEEKQIKC